MNIGFGGVSSYITPFWIARCLRALFPQEEIEITYDQLGTLKHANKYVKVLYFFLVDIPFFRFSWLTFLGQPTHFHGRTPSGTQPWPFRLGLDQPLWLCVLRKAQKWSPILCHFLETIIDVK